MLNRVFCRGDGVASGIDYGLSPIDHTGQRRAVPPRVAFGDPEAVKAAVRSLSCRNRYTAGVLAFAEPQISRRLKRKIINEHLRVTFPGLDVREVAATYIEHRDKGILEIHYWIANVHLTTGKRLTPYFHRADRERLRLWVQSINDRFLLADPNDPARWRLVAPPKKDAPETRKNVQQRLLDALSRLALAGLVRSRAQIEEKLAEAGWKISRRTKNFISVTHPRIRMPLRLTGRMFLAEWSGVGDTDIRRLAREFQAERLTRIRATSARLVSLITKRIAYNARRFGAHGVRATDSLIAAIQSAESQAAATKSKQLERTIRAQLDELLGGDRDASRELESIERGSPATPSLEGDYPFYPQPRGF